MKHLLTILLITSTLLGFALADNAKGKAIYDQSCQTCHNPSTATLMKAPEAHNAKDWKERMTAAEAIAKKEPKKYKNALAVLVTSVKNGKGAMAPGGMCHNQTASDKKCSDADYSAAIKFMMSSKK